jgi:hypothetical protein
LPTLRKTDRDDVLCKLSDEHARHTTFLRRKGLNVKNITEWTHFRLISYY